jgi:hypothetical protein
MRFLNQSTSRRPSGQDCRENTSQSIGAHGDAAFREASGTILPALSSVTLLSCQCYSENKRKLVKVLA